MKHVTDAAENGYPCEYPSGAAGPPFRGARTSLRRNSASCERSRMVLFRLSSLRRADASVASSTYHRSTARPNLSNLSSEFHALRGDQRVTECMRVGASTGFAHFFEK